jgi:thioredoxin-like negative regulator of GroEL
MLTSVAVRQIDDASFQSEVIDSKRNVLVCFTAEAREVNDPWLEEVFENFQPPVTLARSSLKESPRHALQYGVVMTPAYLLFSAGEKRGVAVGSLGPEDLRHYVARALS